MNAAYLRLQMWNWCRQRKAAQASQRHGLLLTTTPLPAAKARDEWSVLLERTVRELQGISCISLDQAPTLKQQIACTRSFGHPITTLPPLIEAASEFASRAAEKLRHGNQRTGALLVFAHTSPFRPGPRFNKSATIPLHPSTSDTTVLVSAAVSGLRRIYESEFQLSKAGVMLLDLCSATEHQQSDLLFEVPPTKRDHSQLMEAVDRINARYGKSTVHVASTGQTQEDECKRTANPC